MDLSANKSDRMQSPTDRSRNPTRDGQSTAGSSTTTSSSATASRHESLVSVPSLYDAAETNKSGSPLAFTTDELQLPVGVIVTPPGSKNKRKIIRRGTMSAIASSDVGVDPSQKVDPPNNVSNVQSGLQLRARPTVTTILRQQHVLEKAEKKEKEKVDLLLTSSFSVLEVDSMAKYQGEKEADESKAAEAKRLLQAKLAYERAKAASRKVADEKQKIAYDIRQKEKELQAKLEEQREAEKEKRRAIAEQLQRTNADSKRAVGAMLRYKHLKASLVKQETEQLQAEARIKQQQEDLKKQDKIQQIQAAKLALKRTKETLGNPNQFYRSIAIPETQIKLRLQKEEEKRRLQETRQKIQEAKQSKSVKLIRAMKKIQSFESISKKQAQELQEKKSITGAFQKPRVSLQEISYSVSSPGIYKDMNNNIVAHFSVNNNQQKDGEIQQMLAELERLKMENLNGRRIDQNRARTVGSSAGSTVRILGTANIVSRSNSSGSGSSSIYNKNPYPQHQTQPSSYSRSNTNNSAKLGVLAVGRH